MYVGMIETRSLKILLKSFHGHYSDLFIKTTRYFAEYELALTVSSPTDYTLHYCCFKQVTVFFAE